MTKQNVTIKQYIAKVDELLPNKKNPRTITKKDFEALKKSLVEFPEMKELREIVIDESSTILGGHQRLYALKDLGIADVTVKQVFGLSEKQKREFMIKDNVANGEWDSDMIANEFDFKELSDWGIKDFKF